MKKRDCSHWHWKEHRLIYFGGAGPEKLDADEQVVPIEGDIESEQEVEEERQEVLEVTEEKNVSREKQLEERERAVRSAACKEFAAYLAGLDNDLLQQVPQETRRIIEDIQVDIAPGLITIDAERLSWRLLKTTDARNDTESLAAQLREAKSLGFRIPPDLIRRALDRLLAYEKTMLETKARMAKKETEEKPQVSRQYFGVLRTRISTILQTQPLILKLENPVYHPQLIEDMKEMRFDSTQQVVLVSPSSSFAEPGAPNITVDGISMVVCSDLERIENRLNESKAAQSTRKFARRMAKREINKTRERHKAHFIPNDLRSTLRELDSRPDGSLVVPSNKVAELNASGRLIGAPDCWEYDAANDVTICKPDVLESYESPSAHTVNQDRDPSVHVKTTKVAAFHGALNNVLRIANERSKMLPNDVAPYYDFNILSKRPDEIKVDVLVHYTKRQMRNIDLSERRHVLHTLIPRQAKLQKAIKRRSPKAAEAGRERGQILKIVSTMISTIPDREERILWNRSKKNPELLAQLPKSEGTLVADIGKNPEQDIEEDAA